MQRQLVATVDYFKQGSFKATAATVTIPQPCWPVLQFKKCSEGGMVCRQPQALTESSSAHTKDS